MTNHFRFLVIALLSLSSATSLAQVEETKTTEKAITHELSLNATQFAQQFLFSSTSLTAATGSSYLVNYKLFGRRMNGLRVGAGGSYDSDNIDPSVQNLSITNGTMSSRIGYERAIPLSKHWGAFYGIDGVFTYNQSKTVFQTTDFFAGIITTTTTRTTMAYGGGPVLGIRFMINDRISLFTEAMLYALQSTDNTQVKGNFPGFLPNGSKNTGMDIDLTTPVSLYFAFNF